MSKRFQTKNFSNTPYAACSIRLDDTPVKGLSLNDAVKLMRGKPGSPIDLTIIREGEDKPLNIEIKRDIIKTTSVKNRMLDDDFGYVRISNFQTKTTADMLKAIRSMKEESDGQLAGLVLDLRNNPGLHRRPRRR